MNEAELEYHYFGRSLGESKKHLVRMFVCPLIYYPIIYFLLGLTILPISSNFKKRIRRIFPCIRRDLYLTYFIVVLRVENNPN